MNSIPCELIQDLLPSYIDDLTSETSGKIIEEHLDGCEKCSEVLRSMRTENESSFAPSEFEKKEIDFLKKNKKKNLKVAIASVAAAVLIICAVLFVRFFVTGDFVYGNWFACTAKVEGNRLVVDGAACDSIHAVSGVYFEEEDGVVTLKTKAVLASPLHRGNFHEEYIAKSEIRQVRVNGRILWDNGSEISDLASAVYETAHDYIGDMSANNRTANALSVPGLLGAYLNELETSKPPYGWKILIRDDISETNAALKKSDMDSLAYVLIAVIGNLDHVTYEYTEGGFAASKTVTAAEATEFFGQNIKDCGSSVRLLNALLEKTGLSSRVY